MIGLLVKSEAKKYAKIRLAIFFYVLTLYSVIYWSVPLFNASCGFQKYQNRINQKIYAGTHNIWQYKIVAMEIADTS